MIIDISDSGFKKIFQDEELYLPKRWDGIDFIAELRKLFSLYIDQLKKSPAIPVHHEYHTVKLEEVRYVTELLIWTIKDYLEGYPKKAFETFSDLMDILKDELVEDNTLDNNPIVLYRAAKEKTDISRTRMFHTPYNMRSKVSTYRYSIAGFPCLYLGTSLEVCCIEINEKPEDSVLASAFKASVSTTLNKKLRIFDLAVKPQDLIESENRNDAIARYVSPDTLSSPEKRCAYLLWYPVIAACSFIHAFPDAPFAAEYIIPQLFMQWIRKNHPVTDSSEITGIRYFSCASIKASDMGYNYVFPTSGKKYSSANPFCRYLIKHFDLTDPVIVHTYKNKKACEEHLSKQPFYKIGHPARIIK